MARRILFFLLAIFFVMQLFQPERNVSNDNSKTELANHYKIPDSVETVLNTICYDCHSNNTDYPWFINLQPIGWYMQSKIRTGKKHLNFSEFGNYTKEQAIRKLSDIEDVMKTNRMPLKSYKWYNKEADLNEQQRNAIAKWASKLKETIQWDSSMAVNKDTLPTTNGSK